MAKRGSIFLNLCDFSAAKLDKIISKLSDIDDILTISEEKLLFLSPTDKRKITDLRSSGQFEKEIAIIKASNFTVIDIFDEQYPRLLKEIDSPPLVLYVWGNVNILSDIGFSVIGTRHPTKYGIKLTKDFTKELSGLGFTIISGLAKGVDTIAHETALNNGTKTIAVLGSGLLNLYPQQNEKLAKRISNNGAVISEFPLNTPPLKENFPRRNRIVSGLAKGVLVTEAAYRSGTLITAHCALEQNREVFAIPGNIDSGLSSGTHRLIKEGAKLIDCIEDIISELNITINQKKDTELCKV